MAARHSRSRIRFEHLALPSVDANGAATTIDGSLLTPPTDIAPRGGILAVNGWETAQSSLLRQLRFLAEQGFSVITYDPQGVTDVLAKERNTLRYQTANLERMANKLADLARANPGDSTALTHALSFAITGEGPDGRPTIGELSEALAQAARSEFRDVSPEASALAQKAAELTNQQRKAINSKDGDVNTVTRSANLADAMSAYDALRARIGEDAPIHGVGQSMGAGLLAILSSQRPVASMMLAMPADYFDTGFLRPQAEESKRNPRLWPTRSDGDTHAQRALKAYPSPVTIVRPENDKVVPQETTFRFLNSATNVNYVTMPNTGHGFFTYEQGKAFRVRMAEHLTQVTGEPVATIERDTPTWLSR